MDELTGFWTDPWGGARQIFDPSSTTNFVGNEGGSVTDVAASTLTQQIQPANTQPMTSGGFLSSLKDITNFGLATYSTLTNANLQMKDSNLRNYLAQANLDLNKTQIGGQIDVAKINATANEKLAQARANTYGTLGVAGNLGQSVGNNSLMLWLTILGLGFGFLQLVRK